MENLDTIIIKILDVIFTFAVGYIIAAYRTNKAMKQAEQERINRLLEAVSDGEKALIRDRVIQAYNHYAEDKGWCPHATKESLANMYKSYKKLGGNGVLENNYHAIMNLKEHEATGDN